LGWVPKICLLDWFFDDVLYEALPEAFLRSFLSAKFSLHKENFVLSFQSVMHQPPGLANQGIVWSHEMIKSGVWTGTFGVVRL
jgi:hypothetical protein